MGPYEITTEGREWRKLQETVESTCMTLFDLNASAEVDLFADVMARLHVFFDQASLSRQLSTQDKICLGMLSRSYQQLVSCWEELRRGRLMSATSHWRSLWETPEYIRAAALDLDFALAWTDPRATTKPERARRVIRRDLNELERGRGDRWAQRRVTEAPVYQPGSHVTQQAAGLTMYKASPEAPGYFVLPEGAYTPGIQPATITTAMLALDILIAALLALDDLVEDEWRHGATSFVTAASGVLTKEGGT